MYLLRIIYVYSFDKRAETKGGRYFGYAIESLPDMFTILFIALYKKRLRIFLRSLFEIKLPNILNFKISPSS